MRGIIKTGKPRGWVLGLFLVILLGICFRWANLSGRVYWVDEVATSIRIAGTTRAQVTEQFATGQILSVQQLLDVQTLDSALPWSATFNALRQSPEHAPLYFLLARLWVQFLGHEIGHETGNGIAQIRSLSVLFSLLSLPAMFWLSSELYRKLFKGKLVRSRRASLIAVSLLSISPYFVAYAQEARPYSLWVLALLLMGASLLRATRTKDFRDWLLYVFCAAVGLYTSVLTLLVLIGQGIYVGLIAKGERKLLQQWFIAAGGVILLFFPWIFVMVQQWGTLQDNTTWARMPLSPIAMVAIWLYSIVVLFFDFPVTVSLSLETIVKASTALLILAMIGVSFASICRSSKSIPLFLMTFALPIPIVLFLIDLLSQGQASATPRYLLPLQLVVLLAVSQGSVPPRIGGLEGRFGAERFLFGRFFRAGILVFLVGLSLLSCIGNLNRTPDYLKAHNRFNPPIASIINQASRPFIVSEAANTMNLLSLSHSLTPTISLQILPTIEPEIALDDCNTNFLFNPPLELIDRLRQSDLLTLQEVYQPDLLTSEDIHLSLWSMDRAKQQHNGNLCQQEAAR